MKIAIFLKSSLLFKFQVSFLFINKTLQLYNFKTRTAINAKISVFVIGVEAIFLLLHNLHDCSFKSEFVPNVSFNFFITLILANSDYK